MGKVLENCQTTFFKGRFINAKDKKCIENNITKANIATSATYPGLSKQQGQFPIIST